MNPGPSNSNQAPLDWQQRLRESIAENPYAKYAEVPNRDAVLHGEPEQADIEGPTDWQATEPPPASEPETNMSWAEWKAEALNRLFKELGKTGQRGRINAATVEHGERRAERNT